ncbi:hypothetical protein OJJOAM_003734 [Cupriavidus sp. H18C1]
MHDQVRLAVEQALPRPGHRFDMQVQPCGRMFPEERTQQPQRLRRRTQVADHHAQFAFLAHRQLLGMKLQRMQLAQQRLGVPMKRAPRFRRADPVAAAIEQRQAKLPLQPGHRRKHRGMRPMQNRRGRLEASLADDGVEALQVLQREAGHCLFP